MTESNVYWSLEEDIAWEIRTIGWNLIWKVPASSWGRRRRDEMPTHLPTSDGRRASALTLSLHVFTVHVFQSLSTALETRWKSSHFLIVCETGPSERCREHRIPQYEYAAIGNHARDQDMWQSKIYHSKSPSQLLLESLLIWNSFPCS